MRYAIDPEKHASIFGQHDPIDDGPSGRSRKCKTCGGWHRLDTPWPHNCRPPASPRSRMASPQLAPSFGDGFIADPITGETVTSRNEKREYMARNDFVEYDPGVQKAESEWVREIDHQTDIEATIRRFSETDMDYWTPEQRGEVAGADALATDGQDVDLIESEGLQ